MTELSVKQTNFLEMMSQSDESEEDGFVILSQRDDAWEFFEELESRGFFGVEKNLGPIPSDQEGYIRIPYWRALDYLLAVGTQVERGSADRSVGKKLANVLTEVSIYSAKNDSSDNYHTWWKFAEITALLPIEAISQQLINCVPIWLGSKFDRGSAAQAIGNSLLPKLLGESDKRHHRAALLVFEHLTQIEWVSESRSASQYMKPVTVVENYVLADVIAGQLGSFVAKLPEETSQLLRERVREVYSRGTRAEVSWLFRAAIEDHNQNYEFRGTDNIFVEALRNCLEQISKFDAEFYSQFVLEMFQDSSEIIQRIAVHNFRQQFDHFRQQWLEIIDNGLFKVGLVHETYHLLGDRFFELTEAEQEATIEQLRAFRIDEASEDTEDREKRHRRDLLAAIRGKGSSLVDIEFNNLVDDVGLPGDHPDLLTYHESRWGPGPSPFEKGELIVLLRKGELVDRLNEFVEVGGWNTPTKRALSETLELAVKEWPNDFLEYRDDFFGAGRTYQYAFLKGFLQLIRENVDTPDFDRVVSWEMILQWCSELLASKSFWQDVVVETEALEPNRDWIPPVVAEIIYHVSRRDISAKSTNVYELALGLTETLLRSLTVEPIEEASDFMTATINRPRGKSIEALIELALSRLRTRDEATKSHSEVWENELRPLFDLEADSVEQGNDEFVVLFGNYLPQLQFLSSDWVESNILTVFSKSNAQRFNRALAGLAYATPTRPSYTLLQSKFILTTAVMTKGLSDHVRQRLMERVGLAYIWEDESLDGEIFVALFEGELVKDLEEITRFLWSVHDEKLSKIQVERVLEYWRTTTNWAKEISPCPVSLVAMLARLICYLEKIDDNDSQILRFLAEYADDGHSGYFFAEHICRLAKIYPDKVVEALLVYVQSDKSHYDFEDYIYDATIAVRDAGYRLETMKISEIMRSEQKFRELYESIRG